MCLILMIGLDISKGDVNGDSKPNDILKASGKKFLETLIIFLLPTIVDFSLWLVSDLTGYQSCWVNANVSEIKKLNFLY